MPAKSFQGLFTWTAIQMIYPVKYFHEDNMHIIASCHIYYNYFIMLSALPRSL